MALNKRSYLITQGWRARPTDMLRAVASATAIRKTDHRVANGHSTMNPCNAAYSRWSTALFRAAEAGAMPQMFGVPTITDGIGMGTEA